MTFCYAFELENFKLKVLFMVSVTPAHFDHGWRHGNLHSIGSIL